MPRLGGTSRASRSRAVSATVLAGLWVRGALAGSSPGDAFSVHVGLGETMTAQDILDGTLRVTVLVALVRPAEFTELTVQLQMHSR